MNAWKVTLIAALAAVLAGCGTTRINTQAMEAYGEALGHQRVLAEQHAATTATSATMCAHDANPGLCVVALQLASNAGRPNQTIQMPQLRSPGEEFARGFGPIASLASAGIQVWGAGWLVDRSGRNAVDLVGAVGGVVGQVQGPIDNSVTVGGDQIGGSRIDDRSVAVGGDQIGGNRVDDRSVAVGGDQVGGDQRIGDDLSGSCIGPECRANSPGPIDQSDQSDNSDNSDNSTSNPTPPEP